MFEYTGVGKIFRPGKLRIDPKSEDTRGQLQLGQSSGFWNFYATREHAEVFMIPWWF